MAGAGLFALVVHLKTSVPAGTPLLDALHIVQRKLRPAEMVYLEPVVLAYGGVRHTVVAGDYTATDALCAVLSGTGLTFWSDSRHMVIKPEEGDQTLANRCGLDKWSSPSAINPPSWPGAARSEAP